MHARREHPLFFAEPRSLRAAGLSLALGTTVLVVNAGAGSARVSTAAAAVGGALLLGAAPAARRRLVPAAVVGAVVVAAAVLSAWALDAARAALLVVATRVLCGVVWVLWLGTRVDWAALRALLLRARVPEAAVGTLDHAVLHGLLTGSEWRRRRDAARLRLGSARLPVRAWGAVLGEGAFSAFTRVEQVEERAVLRAAAPGAAADGAAADGAAVALHPAVALRGVDVERGEVPVLRGVDLALGPGEWLALCGASGAGKSSLLRVIAGLDAPTRGALERLGAPIGPATPLARRLDGRVGLLAQNPEHHFLASTVAEDVAWGLLRRGVPPAEAAARARATAEALGVGHLLDRPCHALSFGEQRRVALAGLLVLDPVVLLLDEPTAGLDPVAAHALARCVRDGARRVGAACIWATHDLHALPPDIGRVALLHEGRLAFDGPAAAALTPDRLRDAGLAVRPEARP